MALFIATIFLTALGCISDQPAEGDPSSDPDPSVFEVLHQEISDCGGFDVALVEEYEGDYCDAEVLHWTYDAASSTLELSDERIELNCCGDHDMTLGLIDGVYVASETDAPLAGGSRCNCSCVFDFSIAAKGVPEEVITLRLERHVTDGSAMGGVIWEGTLDLSQGAGWVVVDDTESFMCGDY